MAKTWVKQKIEHIKKKTSIGDSRMSMVLALTKNRNVKNTEGKEND